MNKKIKILLMIVFIAGVTVIAVLFGLQEEVLPVGSKLPEINLSSLNGKFEINTSNKPLMIMFFEPDCPHCEYEFEVMNKRIDQLNNINIYFVTTDKKYIQDSFFSKWNNLANKNSVVFAYIDEKEFKEKIGINITPVFLFYSSTGVLEDKILGETKFDRLLQSIKKAGGAQHQQSGLN
ncbi:MAG: thioredoxin family protein [Bacteroidota bacterium]